MDIEKLEITRFGCLRDVAMDDLGPGVHVFHGTNETGKTTLLEFVRGMLFGFGSLIRRGVIDANVENLGRLVVRPVTDGRLWSVVRRRTADTPITGKNAHDELLVIDDAAREHVRTSLEEWTGGLDEASYVSVMAFGLDELHEFSSLQAAGCGGRLYELAGGLDRGHVFRVMESLRSAIERADSGDPTTSPLAALQRRHDAVCERIEAASSPALTRGQQVIDARRVRAEISSVEPQLAAASLQHTQLLEAIELEPLVQELAEAKEAVEQFDPEDLVHPDYRRWRRLDKRRRRMQRVLETRHEARRRLAAEGRKLAKPSAVWQKRRLIRPLLDDEPRLERLTAEAARTRPQHCLPPAALAKSWAALVSPGSLTMTPPRRIADRFCQRVFAPPSVHCVPSRLPARQPPARCGLQPLRWKRFNWKSQRPSLGLLPIGLPPVSSSQSSWSMPLRWSH